MFIINLDRSDRKPLYKQIYNHIKLLIDTNILNPGYRLPSTRDLSGHLGLNRTTVYKAYEELWANGYIESSQGSYSTVRRRIRTIKTVPDTKKKSIIDWDKRVNQNIAAICADKSADTKQTDKKRIDFIPLSPDPNFIPKKEFKKCLNEVITENKPEVFQYGNEYGLTPLRNFIATQMQLHGIAVKENEILITNGAQNAIDLIIKLFIKPGLKIVIEKPTYSSILPLLRYYNLELIEVPMNDNGMDLEVLESVLQKKNPDLIYTIPNFHNPTGITSSQEHRERFLEICEKYTTPIIEDGFVEELKYFGKNILPIKSMDKNGIVFYIGTFSKILFPGLRIGWIAANSGCIEKLGAIKKASEISGNTLNQSAVNLFCRKGLYEIHIKRIHKIYKKRMQIALKALRENLTNKNVKHTKPFGGYLIWFELNNLKQNEAGLIKEMSNSGVLVSPGNLFYSKPNDKVNFRISIAHRTENEIGKGIKIITEVLNNLNK